MNDRHGLVSSIMASLKWVVLVVVTGYLSEGASAQQVPWPALVGYWHNWNAASAPAMALDKVDARYNVVVVAFAVPVGGTRFRMGFTPDGASPQQFAAQVRALRDAGRTVLISIGGANDPVRLQTAAERDTFVTTMNTIIDAYGFDGVDIDLEGGSLQISGGSIAQPFDAPTVNLIAAVTQLMDDFRMKRGRKMVLTLAPETAHVQGGMSAFAGVWGAYLPVLHALHDSIDIVHVQLYNSGTMYGIDRGIYAQGTADFIVAMTEAVIQGFGTAGGMYNGLAPSQVAVGLPAAPDAAGGGFTDTATVHAAVRYLLGRGARPGQYTLWRSGGYPGLRGMMTWSVNWDATSKSRIPGEYARNFERIYGNTTGIEDIAATMQLRIHPNPATTHVTITTDRVLDRITLHDVLGREVRSMTPSSSSTTIDLAPFPPGLYLIRSSQHLGTILKR
jgi:chitinase